MGQRKTYGKSYDGLFLRGPVWWMSFTINRQHFRRSCGTTDAKLAQVILNKTKTEIAEDKWLDRDIARRYTFEQLMDRLFKEHTPTLEPGTQERYKALRSHLQSFFFGMTLAEITTDAILQYVEYRKGQTCKPATRNRELGLLSKAFNLARLWKWAKENPCSLIEREPEGNKNFGRSLSLEEEKALLKAAKPYLNGQLPGIIIMALYCGMRRGEILSLKWKNINMSKRIIETYNEKANRPKFLPMNETVFKLLTNKSKVQALSGYVFHTENNTPISPFNLYREWKKALTTAKIEKFRFHDLRHTFAIRLTEAGSDIYSVAKMLDHTQLSTTERYAKHSVESLRKHAAKLDNYAVKTAKLAQN